MAFAFVNSASNFDSTGTSGTTVDITYTATAGNLLVAWCKHEGATGTISVARSGGTETWTAGTLIDHGNGDLHGQFHYLLACAGGSSVTYRMTTASRAFRSFLLFEFSYSGTASLDTQNTGQGTATTATSGNITTAGTDEVVLGGYGEYSSNTVTSPQINAVAADGSIILGAGNFTAAWYRVLTATFSGGNASCSIGSSQAFICNIIAIRTGAGGGSGLDVPRNIRTLTAVNREANF